MRKILTPFFAFLFCSLSSFSQFSDAQPVIDMHMHAYTAWKPEGADSMWIPLYLEMPQQNDELMRKSLAEAKKYHIVKASVSGDFSDVEKWQKAAPEMVIPAVQIDNLDEEKLLALESLLRLGKVKVIGEMGTQYAGITPADEIYDKLFTLAEKYDVPVAIHMGPGPKGGVVHCCPNYASSAGDPLLLEKPLKKHPKLRVYVMHAGWPMLDNMIALLYSYPQVYVDVGVINWYIPRKEFHFYLQRLVNAGFGKRIMFGSDQMNWPGGIRLAVEGIESAEFLSPEEKRDIFFNNAKRFLRL